MTSQVEVLADDPHDRELVANSHPPGWVNPAPSGRYNLVVIGGGTAGLVSAGGAGLLGAKVALIERGLTGGDCLVTGCVPSKAVIRSARAAFDVADARRFGVRVPDGVSVDFAAAFDRMRRARAAISRHDAAARFRDEFGVDVYFGDARFVGPDEVEVNGARLRFRRAIIATGSRPAIPDVPGLREHGLTSETAFNLTDRPDRLLVIGGGPIGCELAQAFARLGSEVTLVQQGVRLLPRDDREAADLLLRVLRRDGIDVRLGTTVRAVNAADADPAPGGSLPETSFRIVELDESGRRTTLRHSRRDAILVATGRAPNVEGVGLDAAGVRFGPEGVEVDDYLRTSNPRVYAAGDICLPFKFTHTADATARLAIQNALFHFRRRVSGLVVPWVTYTDPEVAQVGLHEDEARQKETAIDTYRVPLADVDRAITDGETDGFLKIHVKQGGDKILGATIVARHAGEMLSQITTAMVGGVGLKQMADVIHPYPTQAEAIKRAADECFQRTLSPTLKGVLRRWLAWRR